MKQRAEKWASARVKSGLSIAVTTGCTYLYVYLSYTYLQQQQAAAAAVQRQAQAVEVQYAYRVVAAATPCNSYVRVISIANNMLQQMQHQQYDQQQPVFSITCINNNSMLSLWGGTRYVTYSIRTECNSC